MSDYGPWGEAEASTRKPQQGNGDAWADIVNGLNTISRNNATFSKLVDDLGGTKDSKANNENMKKLRAQNAELIKQMRTALQRPFDRNDKPKHEKLAMQFKDLVAQFEKIANDSLQKEREIVASLSHRETSPMAEATGDNREFTDLKTLGITEVDAQIIDETNRDIKSIEGELQDLAVVYKDVLELVKEGGAMLTQVEHQVQSADTQVAAARTELAQGYEYQQSARKKTVCIIVMLFIIVATIALIVGLVVGLGR